MTGSRVRLAVFTGCVVAVSVLGNVDLAQAGDCGGSSGGGSSSSSDSSSSSSDSYYESSSSEGCSSESSVLGLDACSEFGVGWDTVLPLRVRFGVEVQTPTVVQQRQTVTLKHDDDVHRVAVGAKLAEGGRRIESVRSQVTTAMWATEITGIVADYFSLGVGFTVGGAVSTEITAINEAGAGSASVDGIFAGSGYVSAGARLPLGDLDLWTDVRAGGQGHTLDITSTVGDCVTSDSITIADWLLDVRVGASWFVTPNVSLGAWGGFAPLQEQWGGGAAFTFHLAPYDGVDAL